MERDSDSTVSLSVVRTLGTHGDIEITYRLMMIIIIITSSSSHGDCFVPYSSASFESHF